MSADIGWEEYQQICDKLSRANARVSELEDENKALNKAVETMKAIVTAYDLDNPVRTADVHGAECTCMRCAVDAARAFSPPT